MILAAILAVFAAAMQMVTMYEATRFYLSPGPRRASDLNLVLALSVACIAFLLIQGLHLTLRPAWYTPDNVFVYLWGAFHIGNALLYFSVVKWVSVRNANAQRAAKRDHQQRKGGAHA